MCLSSSDHRLGALFYQVVHDREVVRRKIPNHIYIMLDQPQIDSHGIVIVEASESPFFEELVNLFHSSSEQERVIDHDS